MQKRNESNRENQFSRSSVLTVFVRERREKKRQRERGGCATVTKSRFAHWLSLCSPDASKKSARHTEASNSGATSHTCVLLVCRVRGGGEIHIEKNKISNPKPIRYFIFVNCILFAILQFGKVIWIFSKKSTKYVNLTIVFLTDSNSRTKAPRTLLSRRRINPFSF